jgi:hypothetical protein
MAACKWIIEVEIADVWIADGFNPEADAFQSAINAEMLGYARPDEVKVRIVKAPTEQQIDAATARAVKAEG